MDFRIVMGWPQWVWVALACVNVSVAAMRHGKPQDDYDVRATIVGTLLMLVLLVCGGFFG